MLPNSPVALGKRSPRIDGTSKVTGLHVYGADVQFPGMLYGKVLRSSVPHARLTRVDVQPALGIPGVRAVVTASDIPAARYGVAVKDMTLFASDRLLYIGQPIAAAAAISPEVAEQALKAIRVEFEPLDPIDDPELAISPQSPLVHDNWREYAAPAYVVREDNIASRSRIQFGDVDAAFRSAFKIYEHRFTTPSVHAGYTEPRAAVALWDGSAKLAVWTNAQLPYEVQSTLAEILQLPSSSIRIIVPGIGGGFGGKLRIGMEHFAAVLARKSGKPVKVVSTSEEEFSAAHPRQASVIDIRTAVAKDGRILARSGRVVLDCGAAAGSGPGTAAAALRILAGPYKVENLRLEGLAVYTNKVPTGSFRAPAGPMANFAVESQMDIIADDLGIDPLELRLKNVVQEGDTGPAGEILRGVSIEECLRKAASAIGWNERRPGSGRGKGIACGWWLTAGGSSAVHLKLNVDGTVSVTTGAVEIGTGAMTGVAQIVAQELSIDHSEVKIAQVDTDISPYDWGAQGSRTMSAVGNACIIAARELRERIFSVAAKHLGARPEEMVLRDRSVVAGGQTLSLAKVAQLAQGGAGGLVASGEANSALPAHDPSRVENMPIPAWNDPTFHAHATDLSVDPDTGHVTIHRYVVAQDVGYAINPTYIEGQIEGGVAQGIGQALFEVISFRDGKVLNTGLTDYKMPTSLDVPEIESILIECPSENGPYGAKGVGEPPLVEPPATIANAIAAATGIRFAALPITPEKIVLASKGSAE
jgi:CO/xanthine dehydrogenase Mo-binding subunit